MAVVAVGACTVGIESSEKFAEGTASPCHGELIVFSLFLLASLDRLFPVSDVSCYRSSQVACFLASVNKFRKGKDAAAERLCSTLTHGEVPTHNIAEVPWSKAECPTEGSGHVALRNGHVSATPSPSGHLGGGLL